MENFKPFIVLSHQRSGTTHFCNYLLSGHPDIFSFDELFNQPGHKPTIDALKKHGVPSFYELKYKLIGKFKGGESRYRAYYKDFLKAINSKYGKNIIGFKLFHGQLPSSIHQDFITDENNRVILLTRRNIVQSAVSMYLLYNQNIRNHRSKQELENYKIDVDWCEYWIARNRYQLGKSKAEMEKAGTRYISLHYEDAFNLEALNEVYKFLGADALEVMPQGMKKVASQDKYRKMINLKEFQDRLCNEYNGYLFNQEV